ncbi:MAG: hypothetical protein SVZ03_06190 [Spirochaetota bacterium]|nr:hypothetical protein [Spirochaetota bacterium]
MKFQIAAHESPAKILLNWQSQWHSGFNRVNLFKHFKDLYLFSDNFAQMTVSNYYKGRYALSYRSFFANRLNH